MRASTAYHMRAVAQFSNSVQFMDADHTFATGAVPGTVPAITVTMPAGLTPQPGVEILVSQLSGTVQPQAFVTDLAGNVIWTYTYAGGAQGVILQPIHLLPDGNMLLTISPIIPGVPPGGLAVLREVDLAGNTIREISSATLNTRLAAAGFNFTALTIHHDAIELPNGHVIILVNLNKQFTNLPGFPGMTTVLGDALIDLDANLNPVWVWNSFDHLDINRHPYLFPDWTHSNAILYSPSDGNLLLSVRHQNWILKIDYNNGQGAGDIIWRLGEGGDFALQGGTDPTDWFYAQHGPSFIGSATSGAFSMILFDNGDDRMFPPSTGCGTPGQPPCFYSTVLILNVDESAKTATLAFHYTAPHYSFFGGNAEVLANGDPEFDECATVVASPGVAVIYEVTRETTPQIVWQMNVASDAYRAFRLPSLYPGVQW
jgi:arylsulfate sulfotransferase